MRRCRQYRHFSQLRRFALSRHFARVRPLRTLSPTSRPVDETPKTPSSQSRADLSSFGFKVDHSTTVSGELKKMKEGKV